MSGRTQKAVYRRVKYRDFPGWGSISVGRLFGFWRRWGRGSSGMLGLPLRPRILNRGGWGEPSNDREERGSMESGTSGESEY